MRYELSFDTNFYVYFDKNYVCTFCKSVWKLSKQHSVLLFRGICEDYG